MYIETKEDSSVLYFFKNLFSDTPFVKVLEGYTDGEELTLPTISVETGKLTLKNIELGSKTKQRIRSYSAKIYGKSKSQVKDFAYKILNALNDDIIVYNYDEGFQPDVTPSVEENLEVVSMHFIPVETPPELVEKLYYRGLVTFVAMNDRT